MQTQHVERAIGTGRIPSAAASLADFYRKDCHRLLIERRMFREEMDKTTDAGERAELEKALQENALEDERLQTGWANSSLRRHVLSRAESGQHEPGGIEQRAGIVTSSDLALPMEGRATTDTSATLTAKRLVGHAAVFDKWANIGYFRERIAPGAFAEALKTSDVRFLFNHDPNYVYGRNTANTLELEEDRIGLAFTCYLLSFDAQSYALARRIDRRDVSGCSFSFTVKRDTWKLAAKLGEIDERTILEIDTVYDVAAVTYPAYPQTDIQAIFENIPARTADPVQVARGADADYEEFDTYDRDCVAYAQLDRLQARLGISPERQRQIERGYRKAERIINRNRFRQ